MIYQHFDTMRFDRPVVRYFGVNKDTVLDSTRVGL